MEKLINGGHKSLCEVMFNVINFWYKPTNTLENQWSQELGFKG